VYFAESPVEWTPRAKKAATVAWSFGIQVQGMPGVIQDDKASVPSNLKAGVRVRSDSSGSFLLTTSSIAASRAVGVSGCVVLLLVAMLMYFLCFFVEMLLKDVKVAV
jgi:hypothetical protein